MLIKRALLVILVIFAPWFIFGQITTSSITGSVKDEKNQVLPGATITAVHTPTGSTYTTTLGKQGVFNLPNLRVGGPYKLTVTYVGFETRVFEDINLTLGTPLTIDAVLSNKGATLSDVVVTAN